MTRTNNENGDMVFNPSMLKTLYERSLKQIVELQEKLSKQSEILMGYISGYELKTHLLTCANEKISHRNLQIADLKKKLAKSNEIVLDTTKEV